MNILFVASEVSPFAKTGGLADVSGALPKSLSKLGNEVKVVMPRYYGIQRDNLEKLPISLGVDMGNLGELWAGVYRGYLPKSKVEVYFLEYEEFFGRSGLYDENGFAYDDNAMRFIFFSKASLILSKALNFKADIIHANDWHSACIPIFLKTTYLHDEFFRDTSSILTIHNLQHQGNFDKSIMDILSIGWEHFTPLELEAMGRVNLLKGGITFCDILSTVSKKYSHEIQTSEYGFGLEKHIRAHSYKFYGILNGVDYDEWSPAVDKYIVKNYDMNSFDGKKECKKDLQKLFDLPVKAKIPLIGFVGRLVGQKGIDLIASVINGVMDMDIQVVMLGSGEKRAEEFFRKTVLKYQGKFGCYIGYNNEIAHKIEAGSDMFLMPSLFEPCGLNQIYSLRYATLPIVRATGGLDDTVKNYDGEKERGNGFKFFLATPDALYHTIKWAVDTYYHKPNSFKKMQFRAMKEHFSWMDVASKYEDVYKSLYYSKKIQRYK